MDYQRIYNQIIEKARKENRDKGKGVYYEAHHIIPICLGGDGKVNQYRRHPNIILLTAKEHYVSHRLLCRIHPGVQKLIHAYWAMCNQKNKHQSVRYVPSARAYQEAKLLAATIDHTGRNNGMYGKKHTQEWKEARTGDNHWYYGKKRPEHSTWMKENSTRKGIAPASPFKAGKDNPSYGRVGKLNPRSIQIIDVETGVEYESRTVLEKLVGVWEVVKGLKNKKYIKKLEIN
jgi:hypothetical protein